MSLCGVVSRDVGRRPELRVFYHHRHPTTTASFLTPDGASRFASFKKVSQCYRLGSPIGKNCIIGFFPQGKILILQCFLSIGLDAKRLRVFKVKTSETSDKSQSPIAPLQMESPIGQLLFQIMETHPHLLPSTIEQQLEKLQEERNLHGDEKTRALQDVLYRLIGIFYSLQSFDKQMLYS